VIIAVELNLIDAQAARVVFYVYPFSGLQGVLVLVLSFISMLLLKLTLRIALLGSSLRSMHAARLALEGSSVHKLEKVDRFTLTSKGITT
jgi:hypothetical protein